MTDRDAILARRALFVGAALASIAPGARATDRCRPSEPTEADRSASEDHVQRAVRAAEQRDFDGAHAELTRAYELSPSPRLALQLARAARAAGNAVALARALERYVACSDDEQTRERARAQLSEIASTLGVIEVRAPAESEVTLDGVVLSAEVRAYTLFVTPGEHELVISDGRGSRRTQVSVGAGERQVIEVEAPPDCDAEPALCMPCLSQVTCDDDPALCMPCLSPPPPEQWVRQAHLTLEAGYALHLDSSREESDDGVGHGLWLAPMLNLPLGDVSSLGLGAYLAPAWTPDGDFLRFGPDARARVGGANWAAGVGVRGGWLALLRDEPRAGRSRPVSGWNVEPYLDLMALRVFERVTAGLRASLLLSREASRDAERFGLSHVTTGVWIGYAFGRDCDEDLSWTCPKRGLLDEW